MWGPECWPCTSTAKAGDKLTITYIMVNPTVALLARLSGFSFGQSKAPIYHLKPPGGRLWRDLIIAKNDRTQNPYRGTNQRRATAPRGKLCWHSPSDRGKNRKNLRGRVGKLPARNVSPRAKGFLDRRSKRRFWLLLPPGAKVARARRARKPPAFPLRGRWQREALTDEVSLRASPQTGMAIRSSRRQPPWPPLGGGCRRRRLGERKNNQPHFTQKPLHLPKL